MPRRIRILYPVTERSFAERLEQQARTMIKRPDRNGQPSSTIRSLEQELALTLDHLDKTRELHESLRRNLVRIECYVDNELIDMERRTPKYSPYRFPEREKLQRRLIRIEEERRRLALQEHEQVRELRAQLLSLLGKRELLRVDRGR